MGSLSSNSTIETSHVESVDFTPISSSFTNAPIPSPMSSIELIPSGGGSTTHESSIVDFEEISESNVLKELQRIMNDQQVPMEQARVMLALDMEKDQAQYFIERAGSDDSVLTSIQRLFDALEGNSEHFEEAISDILYDAANVPNRNASGLKLICSAAVKLLNLNSVSNAEVLIGDIFGDVIETRIGFDSYKDPETGLVIQFPKNMNWNNQSNTPEAILLRFNMLPEHLKKYIKKIYLYDVFNPYDLYWEKEYGIADFQAEAGSANGALYVYSRADLFDILTLAHESAHEYDTQNTKLWGVDSDTISTSSLWRGAALADYETSGKMGVSLYADASYQGSGSLVEDFAEAVKLFYFDPSALDQYPARKVLLTKYLPQDFHITAEDGYYLICDVLKSTSGEQDEYFYERLDAVLSGKLLWGYNDEFKLISSLFSLEELRDVDRRVRNQ